MRGGPHYQRGALAQGIRRADAHTDPNEFGEPCERRGEIWVNHGGGVRLDIFLKKVLA